MDTIDFSQTLPIFKELAEYYPHIANSEYDLFLTCTETNFNKSFECQPHLYVIMQIIKKSHQMYLELIDRENEKINLLYNIRNEPTKTITNYLKKIEMANTLYSQIMFEDDTNYFPLIEKILNDFKDNPAETMQFFQENRKKLDSRGGAFKVPFKNGYKDLYKREQSHAYAKPPQDYYIQLKKEIIINYYYELLQAYPIITKDINQIKKKLYTSASIKIFKYLQLQHCSIKPYRLKEYIEELFVALAYPIKVYPDKIDQAYLFALHNKHYMYKYPNKDNSYNLPFPGVMNTFIF